MADGLPKPPPPVQRSAGKAPAADSSTSAGRRTLDYAARNRLPGRWMWLRLRRIVNRESIINGLKTLMWAVPLTVLIWVYAEREGVDTVKGYNLVIGLQNNDRAQRVLRLLSQTDGSIRVDLTGPHAQMEMLQKKLSSSPDPLIRLAVEAGLPGGQHPISVSSIANDPLFVDNGITVSAFDPPDVLVEVDPLRNQELQVQAPPSANLASPPAFEPRKVHVRIPQSLLSGATQYGAFAQLDSFTDIKTPGTHDLSNVPIALYALDAAGQPTGAAVSDPAVTMTPTFVSAKIEVKSSDETYELQTVPVWPLMPPVMLEKYQVKLGDPAPVGVLSKVKVVGPPDQIAALKKPDYSPRPYAWFKVDPNNQQTNTTYSSPIKVEGLPEGVHVSPDDQNRSINYQLTDRVAPGG